MVRFNDLGIPFPLFMGNVEDAAEYIGKGTCYSCHQEKEHCFKLGIGSTIVFECTHCGSENGLDAADRNDGICISCKNTIRFPEMPGRVPSICYECLRAGKGAFTKDTELGMISWEQTLNGITHGRPGLDRTDFELVPVGDDWIGAKLSADIMFELLRTPTFVTIQGEVWQFCCARPMVYIGTWSREDFSLHAEDGDGKSLFQLIIQDNVEGLWEDQLGDEIGIYVFEFSTCKSKRAIWDMA